MVKVISLSERAYAVLKRYKGNNLSFSEAVLARFADEDDEKTEGTKEMLEWIRILKAGGKKEPLHARIDEIVYGVKR